VRAVRLSGSMLREMQAHARASYPEECCGFLIGASSSTEPADERTVLSTERAGNEYDGERRRRFLIPPDELRLVERRLENAGRAVVGFYHSHPDHPARPSQFDQEHAWPWYSYLVLSVTADEVPAVGAFELDEESGVFHKVALAVLEDSVTSPPLARG